MKFLTLSLTLLCWSFSVMSQNQKVSWGVKGGMTYSRLSRQTGSDFKDYDKSVPFFFFGTTVEIPVNNRFNFQSGIVLTSKGAEYDLLEIIPNSSILIASRIKILYLEIPANLLVRLPVGTGNLQIGAGPYYGFGIAALANSKRQRPGQDLEENNAQLFFGKPYYGGDYIAGGELKRSELGLNFLVIVNPSGRLSLNSCYGLGLTGITYFDDNKTKNRVLSVGLGYRF